LLHSHISHPLLENFPMLVEQEEMWFHTVMEPLLEQLGFRIIDIKIDEIDPPEVFLLDALHHRRHRPARTAPEGKEFD
jgi:hypothetical protein